MCNLSARHSLFTSLAGHRTRQYGCPERFVSNRNHGWDCVRAERGKGFIGVRFRYPVPLVPSHIAKLQVQDGDKQQN